MKQDDKVVWPDVRYFIGPKSNKTFLIISPNSFSQSYSFNVIFVFW